MIFCLDTNICIYALKGQYGSLKSKIQTMAPLHIKIPSLVRAELLLGAKKSGAPQRAFEVIEKFLFPFEVLPFEKQASEIYADIRYQLETEGKVIGPNDLVIAATVISNNAVLVTHNTKEFRRIKNLKIEDWV